MKVALIILIGMSLLLLLENYRYWENQSGHYDLIERIVIKDKKTKKIWR